MCLVSFSSSRGWRLICHGGFRASTSFTGCAGGTGCRRRSRRCCPRPRSWRLSRRGGGFPGGGRGRVPGGGGGGRGGGGRRGGGRPTGCAAWGWVAVGAPGVRGWGVY